MLSNKGLKNIICCVFFFMVIPLGVAVCKRLYDKIKSEEHKEKGKVVQTLIKNYCLIQMIGCPGLFLLTWPTQMNNDNLHIIDSSDTIIVIHIVRAMYHFHRVYLSFHSLIVATTRYTFLMYDIQTEFYGVKKFRNLFISLSIGVPLIHTIISICVQPLEVRWFSLFSVYNDSVSVPSEAHGLFFHRVTTAEEYNISLYYLINKLLPSPLVFGLQIFDSAIFLLISMNIAELFLYTHLFIHFHRYDSIPFNCYFNNLVFSNLHIRFYVMILMYYFRLEQENGINELLNDNAKRSRKHTQTVNIQMSVMTWSIEFITGCVLMIHFTMSDNITIIIIISLFDVIMTFVVIPGAYILNTEVMKSKIIQNGWFRSLRTLTSSGRIQPAANEEGNVQNIQ